MGHKSEGHPDGEENPDKVILSVPWKKDAEGTAQVGLLDVRAMVDRVAALLFLPGPMSPAEFALQMVEGVDRVRFERESAMGEPPK